MKNIHEKTNRSRTIHSCPGDLQEMLEAVEDHQRNDEALEDEYSNDEGHQSRRRAIRQVKKKG
jgi:hypothetical protein